MPPQHRLLPYGNSYILPKGTVGEKDKRGQKYICWQGFPEGTYYVCANCKTINSLGMKIDHQQESGYGFFLDGDRMGTLGCVVCINCKAHLWFVFQDWPVENLKEKIKKDPTCCPFCGSRGYLPNPSFSCTCGFNWTVP